MTEEYTEKFHQTIVAVDGLIKEGKEWVAVRLPAVDPHNPKYIRTSDIPEELLEQAYGKIQPCFIAWATTGCENLYQLEIKDWQSMEGISDKVIRY